MRKVEVMTLVLLLDPEDVRRDLHSTSLVLMVRYTAYAGSSLARDRACHIALKIEVDGSRDLSSFTLSSHTAKTESYRRESDGEFDGEHHLLYCFHKQLARS